MMLRRLKEDVEKNIAPKEETIIEVHFFSHKLSSEFANINIAERCFKIKVDDYLRKKLVNRLWNFHGRFLA